MEDERLTDGPPVRVPGRGEYIEGEDEGETEQDGHGSEHWGHEEHHDGGPQQTHQAGVPREVLERGPGNIHRGL